MNGSVRIPASDPRYGWLGFVLPADARRFRTDDPGLDALLAEAGAEVVASGPDVEIGHAEHLRGDASTAVVAFHRHPPDRGPRSLRGVRRIGGGALLRLGQRRASRAARRLGYEETSSIAWERSMPVVGAGLPKAARSPLAHRLPLNAVVVAHRNGAGRTIFDDVIDAARAATGQALSPSRVIFGSSGVVVADLGAAVLRLAIGPAGARLAAHSDTLEQLHALGPPSELGNRVPSLLAHGQEGLAAWTLEKRLLGEHPTLLNGALVEEAAEFLADLGRLSAAGSARERLLSAAETVGRACSENLEEELSQLAANALDELTDHDRCFVHGDFWTGNLLVEGNRLTGVIDWPEGGPDGVPLLDALHLQLSSLREATREPLGLAVANHFLANHELLEYEVLRACNARLDLRLTVAEQRALVVAYWLDAVARELRDPDAPHDSDRAGWERDNITPVLRVLRDGHRAPRPKPSQAASAS